MSAQSPPSRRKLKEWQRKRVSSTHLRAHCSSDTCSWWALIHVCSLFPVVFSKSRTYAPAVATYTYSERDTCGTVDIPGAAGALTLVVVDVRVRDQDHVCILVINSEQEALALRVVDVERTTPEVGFHDARFRACLARRICHLFERNGGETDTSLAIVQLPE